MFKNRTDLVTFSLICIASISIILGFVLILVKTDSNKPCETFLPDPYHFGPGQQCSEDKRTYLKIYENGNVLCICKDSK